MARNNLINMALMQILWFITVFAAAADRLWLGLPVLLLFLVWQMRSAIRISGDFRLIPAALLLGLILDGAWIRLGWLEYASPWPVAKHAPLWILSLWVGLALTLNHSLAWLQSKLWLAGVLGGVAAPFSYAAAERIGALRFTIGAEVWIIGLGLSWAMAIPLLLWLARKLKRRARPLETNHV